MALINAIPDASRTIYRELYVEELALSDCGKEVTSFLATCDGLTDVAGVTLAQAQEWRAEDIPARTEINIDAARIARIQAHLDGTTPIATHLFEIDAALDGRETSLSEPATTYLQQFCGMQALVLANTPQAEQKDVAETFMADYPGAADTINGLARKEIKQQRETTA